MSSYLNKYIEVKRGGKWHLVKLNAIDKDGNAKEITELSHGLILRDELNWKRPGWDGLPKDISDELKGITEKLNESLKKVGWSCGYAFHWATLTEFKAILEKETEDFVNSVRNNIKKQEDNKILDGIEEIKALIKGQEYKKKKKKKAEEYDEFEYYDTIDYNLDTEGYESGTIGHLLSLTEAINELELLGYLYLDDEFEDNATDDDIRIIYYFD